VLTWGAGDESDVVARNPSIGVSGRRCADGRGGTNVGGRQRLVMDQAE